MKLHFIAIEFIVILQHEIIFSNETSECIIPHDILGHGGLPHVNKYKSCYLSSLDDLGKEFFPFIALLMSFKLMTIFIIYGSWQLTEKNISLCIKTKALKSSINYNSCQKNKLSSKCLGNKLGHDVILKANSYQAIP